MAVDARQARGSGAPHPIDAATRVTPAPRVRPSRGFLSSSVRRFAHDPLSVVALGIFGLIVVITVLAPWLAANVLHSSPEEFTRTPEGRIATLQPPSQLYLLGTDELGRDNLTRLLYAGQVSLTVGFLVAFVSIVIGTSLGLVAGFYGGRADDLVNALVQFVINIPSLFVLIILSVLFTPSVLSLAVIFGLFYWPGTTRQVRGMVLSVQGRDYVDAARALGARDLRILAVHILPNVASIVIVVAGLDVASAILGESALSFLGFGVPVPLSSWGNMLSGSQDTFRSAPWLVYPPGAMILATVLCIFLLADGLRDAFDPRIHE
ncbi:MAG TPA: ABC transporter permease [Chloroflexota bacterium]|nr:ABC transporter permease [Chloroflexota bacterium]